MRGNFTRFMMSIMVSFFAHTPPYFFIRALPPRGGERRCLLAPPLSPPAAVALVMEVSALASKVLSEHVTTHAERLARYVAGKRAGHAPSS